MMGLFANIIAMIFASISIGAIALVICLPFLLQWMDARRERKRIIQSFDRRLELLRQANARRDVTPYDGRY